MSGTVWEFSLDPFRRLSFSAASWVPGLLDSVLGLPSTAALTCGSGSPTPPNRLSHSPPCLPPLTLHCARQPWQTHTLQPAYLCWVPARAVFPLPAPGLVPHSRALWHPGCLRFILISLPLLLLTYSAPFCPMIWGLSLFCV